ncbi:MAG: NAD(+) diphosphatase [Salinarimonadaceae bacterium]|nr:MAG: NAD(+) diphosphatase [Salinarimonadaceae bacterium]
MPPHPPPLGFAMNGLARHTSEHDDEALARYGDDPDALVVLLAGEIPVLRRLPGGEGPAATALHARSALNGVAAGEKIYLGSIDGRHVLAFQGEAGLVEEWGSRPDLLVLDLRSIATQGLVAEREAGMLAEAKSLLSWHANHRFCARCGGPTRATRSGFRRDCEACGAQHFPRTDPVVIMLITHGERVLLGRQARFPTGNYSCLAGFVEPGETIEDAVRRETFEEAGVCVGEVSYMLSQPWPFPSSLMIGCRGEALNDDINFDREELEDCRWFDRTDLDLMLRDAHPDGVRTPPSVAIAYHLIRIFLS